ncbi:hypothetical protein PHYBLDRAFT_153410 [Phycomyces blakesleeanus NRRL 1555(-)]|uniref:Uncharacterized protein n=1 Tax=Phycomyces blakesleeanus (strain ATCC 8743b / DSM 1359 / FGSC 10004 / NBRC 33097 / NRRL 1555) TaxID=763407 RepID=A0A163CTI9_PHYB8|nr:hypothetical protein PHYBLDRAFT_153410 [Phycomyces blakesleeanus NRRL 1555(-)]OAD65510.1 hypothetical protein PHYBLDRAFT_153410 [Phycomyces blakesleeanus NRRL 1555(-)]|eukprot:XP_018283550.1 hypothetical protein PHYBLDRAFT_153410 [Phycomyces blakesleeanus NRRL 1555(-)]
MSSNCTNFSINEINDDHMIHIAPNYKSANPTATETSANEEAFSFWFENSAKRHSNWNMTSTHVFQATSTASPKDVVTAVYLSVTTKDDCKAKITKKILQNGNVVVDYLWQHVTHQPEKVQDMVRSRLPAEVKQWIVFHVDNNMDWKAIKMLFRIDSKCLEELEAGLGISSFPMSLHINYHDVQNVINACLNKLSKKMSLIRQVSSNGSSS